MSEGKPKEEGKQKPPKPKPVRRVMGKLRIRSQAGLARALGIDRTCPSDWNKRLKGNIPSKHWLALIDIGLMKGVWLTMGDFTDN